MKRFCRPTSLLGKPCVALDYQLTAYWGQCISVSESYRVTLKYYRGIGKGWKTKEFHHFRVWETATYESKCPEDSPFFDRKAVIRVFKLTVIDYARFCVKYGLYSNPLYFPFGGE